MKKLQKISLSGAMAFTLALGISAEAANAGGTGAALHAEDGYYYYEIDAHENKTTHVDGLTEKELEDKLGYPYKGADSHYYYELGADGEMTEYVTGLTEKELKERLHQYNMQHAPHSGGMMQDAPHSGGMHHSAEEMSSSGEVPDDLEEAEAPKFDVGTTARITADHMQGMDGAEATVTGAFDTTVYTVSYTPTTGGEPVKDHKWVIHEELVDPGEAPLAPGDEAVMTATHMKGMEGAAATIDSAEQTTVYMVDFTTTDTNEAVQNHKWVTESELSSVE